MAPEVLEFRRNQLKAPSDEGNALQTLGAVALAGAAALGAGLAGRRFLRGRQEIPKAPTRAANAGVVQQDLSTVRRIAEIPAPTVKASKVVSPSAPAPTTTENAVPVDPTDRLLEELQEMRIVKAQEGESRLPSRIVMQNPRIVRPQSTTALTDIQQSLEPQAQSQFINAVESGEDQVTGRLIKQINSDDLWGEATIPPSAVNEQNATLLLPAAVSSPREKAQTFLEQQREKISGLSPTRRERALSANPEIAEAAELYASTGDPSVLSRFSETPSSPVAVRSTVQTEIKRDELPLGMFYESKPKFEFTQPLEDQDVNLTNKISALGAEQERVRKRLQEINEAEPMLRYAMASEGPEGGAYSTMYNKLQYEKSQLPDPESFNADLSDAIEERNYIRRQIESLQNLGPKQELINRQEGVRPFFETTGEGEIIPETLEIRTGRPSVDIELKSGGGRQFSAYDPNAASKTSLGIYGIERSDFPTANENVRPTALSQRQLVQEALAKSSADPYGDVPVPPAYEDLIEQEPTAARRASVNMSQAVLKAARMQQKRNPRGGVLPDQTTTLRRQMAQQPVEAGTYSPEVQPFERQATLPGVTGYAARARTTPADIAAQQLESYMSKLQRGRSTPLTSAAVIQPRLF
jgi:hypothetical protein